jgi:hydroxyacylglutathione hydrolase
MILRRFYDDRLAQASYLVGCSATGEALIVDPNRDVKQYLNAAAAEKLRITHVTETHIHADFVSGLRELAATGAKAFLSGMGGEEWSYEFAGDIGATLLQDGAEFMVGNVRVKAIHTPGHTPEHMSFIITDTAGADQPMGVFTGDFIFVGDVGRPDLLEKAAGVTGTMENAARQLFGSVQRFRALPEWLQLWPGHGAGSACGKALGAVPSTTLGYEKLFNMSVAMTDEREFIDSVLAGQPTPPKYFKHMKRINREGPPVLGGISAPPQEDESRLRTVLEAGGLVVDTRLWSEYRTAFVPGTINIPLNKSFPTYAGWLIPYDVPFHIIATRATVHDAARSLAMIGLDRIAGWFDASGIDVDTASGRLSETTPAEVRSRGDTVAIIDVRWPDEYSANHIPGAPNIPMGSVAEQIADIPRDRPVVLHCQGGGRSAIATSILAAHGITDVTNMTGGFERWVREGNPIESETRLSPETL